MRFNRSLSTLGRASARGGTAFLTGAAVAVLRTGFFAGAFLTGCLAVFLTIFLTAFAGAFLAGTALDFGLALAGALLLAVLALAAGAFVLRVGVLRVRVGFSVQGTKFSMASAAAPRACSRSAVELSGWRRPSSTVRLGGEPRWRDTP